MKIIFTLLCFCFTSTFLFSQQASKTSTDDDEGYYSGAYAVGPTCFLPADFKYDTDPMWGFQINAYSCQGGYSGMKLSMISGNYASLTQNVSPDISFDGSSQLLHASLDYMFSSFPNGKLNGLFGYIGAGYAREIVTIKTKINNVSKEEKSEKGEFILEGGAGFFIKSGAIDFKYVMFTGSGNASGAILISLMIFVGNLPM